MISLDSVFPIGQIQKPHGIHGEMSFAFTSDVFDRVKVPFFIIEREGILVPFFLKNHRMKSSATALISFEGVDNEDAAGSFSGYTVYLPKTYLEEVEDEEIELDYFAGFMIRLTDGTDIGEISEVDQTTDNALFVIEKENGELLIPIGDEYIVEIDHQHKIIVMELPDGLLDL